MRHVDEGGEGAVAGLDRQDGSGADGEGDPAADQHRAQRRVGDAGADAAGRAPGEVDPGRADTEPGVLGGDLLGEPPMLREQRALGGVGADLGRGVLVEENPAEGAHPPLEGVPPHVRVEALLGRSDGGGADREHGQRQHEDQQGMEHGENGRGGDEVEEGCGQGDDLAHDLPREVQAPVGGPVDIVVPVRVVDRFEPYVGDQLVELHFQSGADLRGEAGLGGGDRGLQRGPQRQERHDQGQLGQRGADLVRCRSGREQRVEDSDRSDQAEGVHRRGHQLQYGDRDGAPPVRPPCQRPDLPHDPR
ncbi:hypothetical protein FF041_29250 [Streptomyces jumonjinensis]|uniref:Uncharacterized protein n=1 Tax=Streptomyces jumonjinensis TaxID=1945 RepID=A0A646KP64_STRJU|nr:hypothetical protein [Streptomyces jumonjinensis]